MGIGTENPSKRLHINGEFLSESNGWNHSDIKAKGAGKDAVLRLYDDNDYWSFHNDDSAANDLSIRFNNSTKLSIAKDGNVGIGTTSPDQKLAVNGSIRSKEVLVEASDWPDFVFEKTMTFLHLLR